jgi:hypothetical protein
LPIFKWVNRNKLYRKIFSFFYYLFEERHHSIETESPAVTPTTESLSRLSQHELSPLQQSLPNNTNIQSSDSDRLMYILIFLYEKIPYLSMNNPNFCIF